MSIPWDGHRTAHTETQTRRYASLRTTIAPIIGYLNDDAIVEIMLNAGNLLLVAGSRYVGGNDGHVFALVVMAVAAAEVVVGLGLIVALARKGAALDVDELRSLSG